MASWTRRQQGTTAARPPSHPSPPAQHHPQRRCQHGNVAQRDPQLFKEAPPLHSRVAILGSPAAIGAVGCSGAGSGCCQPAGGPPQCGVEGKARHD